MKIFKNISTYYLLSSIVIFLIFLFKILSDDLNFNYNIKYFALSILMIIFSILSFKLEKTYKIYLNITILSIIISIYSFEIYLSYEKLKISQLTKLSFIEKYRKTIKTEVVGVIPPKTHLNKNYDYFPLSGISKLETVYCNELGFFTTYKSDRYGFNNSDYLWDEKIIDYVLIGDSFVHGACVHNKDNLSNQIMRISKKNSLNLGMGGNSVLINFATIKEYVKKNKVKNVLLFFTEDNDLEGLKNEAENEILKKYLIEKNFRQDLNKKQKQLDSLLLTVYKNELKKEKKKESKNKKIHIYEILKLYKFRSLTIDFFDKKKFDTIDSYNLFEQIITDVDNYLKQNKIELYVIYLPSYSRITNREYNESKYKKVMNILNDKQIKIIDIYNELFKNKKNIINLFTLSGAGHYNSEGYRLISEIVYKKISGQKF
jgi:lysophospholipase L1-like esterase